MFTPFFSILEIGNMVCGLYPKTFINWGNWGIASTLLGISISKTHPNYRLESFISWLVCIAASLYEGKNEETGHQLGQSYGFRSDKL